MDKEIVNRVAKSGLMTIDLEDFLNESKLVTIDFKDLLYEALILREKPFREYIQSHDWSQYKAKWIGIHCSVDAIIPSWAYMLITASLHHHAERIIHGSMEDLKAAYILEQLDATNLHIYHDKRVLIKGCGKVSIPESAYIAFTDRLIPIVKSLMYGEACSAVPVFKK